jgi:hypothetical protein
MNMTGRPGEAVKLAERALAMNTPTIGWTLRIACEAHLLAGQAPQAISTCEKATGTSIYWFTYLSLAAAYADHGDMDKAAAGVEHERPPEPALARGPTYERDPRYIALPQRSTQLRVRRVAGVLQRRSLPCCHHGPFATLQRQSPARRTLQR